MEQVLRERFAAPVHITVEAGNALEGKALFGSHRVHAWNRRFKSFPPSPPLSRRRRTSPPPPAKAFYGKPFKGTPVPMKELSLDMGTVIVEGKVFAVDHKELKKRNAYVVKFDMTDNTNSVRVSRFMEAGEAKPILENVQVGSVLRVQGKLGRRSIRGRNGSQALRHAARLHARAAGHCPGGEAGGAASAHHHVQHGRPDGYRRRREAGGRPGVTRPSPSPTTALPSPSPTP